MIRYWLFLIYFLQDLALHLRLSCLGEYNISSPPVASWDTDITHPRTHWGIPSTLCRGFCKETSRDSHPLMMSENKIVVGDPGCVNGVVSYSRHWAWVYFFRTIQQSKYRWKKETKESEVPFQEHTTQIHLYYNCCLSYTHKKTLDAISGCLFKSFSRIIWFCKH